MSSEKSTYKNENLGCLSCSHCSVTACKNRQEQKYPEFCLTAHVDQELLDEVMQIYKNDEKIQKIARTAAEIEGTFYGQKTRVEEIIEFVKRTGCKKVGIATCVGLIQEARMFTKILDKYKIDYYVVGCKVGAVDKTEIGVPEHLKLNKGCGHESMCNPIMQAKILNKEKTDFNVIIGLCVGHDTLFTMYAEAPTTTLIAKDRVLAHNPVGALYQSNTMYSRFKDIEA